VKSHLSLQNEDKQARKAWQARLKTARVGPEAKAAKKREPIETTGDLDGRRRKPLFREKPVFTSRNREIAGENVEKQYIEIK